ncbi:MAG: hypothetical protein LBS29_04935 [Endomicrobium sp.]|jgi:hypothetical protein|nr:hypothetical protein [Endomicrobium sp.]
MRLSLGEDFQHEKVKAQYPCIRIRSPGDEFPIIMSILEPGTLRVLIEMNDKVVQLDKTIDKSPLTLQKLLKLYNIDILFSKDEVVTVKSVEELLDVDRFWVKGV